MSRAIDVHTQVRRRSTPSRPQLKVVSMDDDDHEDETEWADHLYADDGDDDVAHENEMELIDSLYGDDDFDEVRPDHWRYYYDQLLMEESIDTDKYME